MKNTKELPVVADDITQLATLQNAYNDERDLVNQLLGQTQMAGAFEDFSRTVRTSKLAFVKENKLYRNLKGKKNTNGSCFLGTWEEFCELLGISHDKANLDIQNLHSFGEAALESMSNMGIGYRQLREFRKLPEDQKIALIETAKSGDKESVLELAEELIAKHTKEKEHLQKQITEAQKETESTRTVSKGKDDHINRLANELTDVKTKLTTRIATETPDQAGAAKRDFVSHIAYSAEAVLRGQLDQAFTALVAHTEQTGIPHNDFMSGLLAQIEQAIHQLREKHDIKAVPGEDEFAWAKEE